MTGRPRILIFLFLGLAAVLGGCSPGKGRVTLRNQTGKTILEGRLRIGTQNFGFDSVKPGAEIPFNFECGECRPCSYQVGLTLENHKQTSETIGFIQRGTDYQDILGIERNTLTLDSVANPSGDGHNFSKGSQSKKLKWILSK